MCELEILLSEVEARKNILFGVVVWTCDGISTVGLENRTINDQKIVQT